MGSRISRTHTDRSVCQGWHWIQKLLSIPLLLGFPQILQNLAILLRTCDITVYLSPYLGFKAPNQLMPALPLHPPWPDKGCSSLRHSPCFWAACFYERLYPARSTERGFTPLSLSSKLRVVSIPDYISVTPSGFRPIFIYVSSLLLPVLAVACSNRTISNNRSAVFSRSQPLARSLDVPIDSCSESHTFSLRSLADSGRADHSFTFAPAPLAQSGVL